MEIKLETQHSFSVKTRHDQNVDAAAASSAADNDMAVENYSSSAEVWHFQSTFQSMKLIHVFVSKVAKATFNQIFLSFL